MPGPDAPSHRIHFPDLPGATPHARLSLEGPEAHHAATVKRLRPGETVELFDGLGLVAPALVVAVTPGKRASIELDLGGPERVAPVAPRVEVWSPPPKGDRLETMIDQLAQVGVALWRPLRTDRAERDAFRADRLERVAIESAKQCGRAHPIAIGEWATPADAPPGALFADASGEPIAPAAADAVLLIGPEGGWSDAERTAAPCTVRFTPHTMRLETAAVAGAACLLAHARTPSTGDSA